MTSFFVRLRQRAISLTTVDSRHSEEQEADSTSPPDNRPSETRSARDFRPSDDPHIVPDINALFEHYASEPERHSGLRPPRATSRAILISRPTEESLPASGSTSPKPSSLHSRPPSDGKDSESPNTSRVPSRTSGRRLSLYRLPQQLSATGLRSTFGRTKTRLEPRKARFTPPSSTRHSRMGSIDSMVALPRPQSRRTKRNSTATSAHSHGNSSRVTSATHTNQSPASSVSKSSSAKSQEGHTVQSSPPLTTSSRQNSANTSLATHSTPSRQSQQVNRTSSYGDLYAFGLVDSPRTFGNATPPSGSSNYYTASATSLPPLPPITHPELIAALEAQGRTPTRTTDSIAVSPSAWNPTTRGRTFPPVRKLKKDIIYRDENGVAIPPRVLIRSLRGSTSLPDAQEIFAANATRLRSNRKSRSRSSSAKRSRSQSTRRDSAEWNSQQAVLGVTSERAYEFGWPAEVSREILRMTLSGRGDAGRTSDTSAGEVQRGRHVPAARTPSTPCFREAVSGFPSPPPLPSSQSFTSPAFSEESDSRALESLPRGGITLIRPGTVVEGEGDSRTMTDIASHGSLRDRRGSSARDAATIPKASNSRTVRKSILNTPSRSSSTTSSKFPEAGPSTPDRFQPYPVPTAPRSSATRPKRSSSEPGLSSVLETPTNVKGKRKAAEVDITPPDQKTAQRATFVIPENGRRVPTQSGPPSSYADYQRKRVRLSTPSPARDQADSSRPSTFQNAANTGSWSRKNTTSPPPLLHRAASRAASTRSTQPPTPTNASVAHSHNLANESRRTERRRSISEMSIPISALVAPHAPSVSRSSTYHMRDPRRPPRIRPTSWSLHFRSEDEEASPFHAWCFFIGFILFPLWWIASFLPIPKTREVGGTDTEKAVTLDDPQVEHDARSWRFRCRVMSAISFLTYIPFIVLVAIFVPK